MDGRLRTHHQVILADARRMLELQDESVHLVVTSPPYPMIEMWDALFRRLDRDMNRLWVQLDSATPTEHREIAAQLYARMHGLLGEVWRECWRVLCEGGLLCINVGDATRKLGGIFRLFPNHAQIILECERIGFITLPYLLWRKPTNRPNAFLGSGFLPTNGYVTLDMEHILIFRKGGPRHLPAHDERRYASRFTKAERDVWFSQTWTLPGVQQEEESGRRTGAYPLEVPSRLIRMFSIIGDTILDPYLGTGTTIRAAINLERNSVGYEVDDSLRDVLKRELPDVEFLTRSTIAAES